MEAEERPAKIPRLDKSQDDGIQKECQDTEQATLTMPQSSHHFDAESQSEALLDPTPPSPGQVPTTQSATISDPSAAAPPTMDPVDEKIGSADPPLSKSALKKLRRQERWEAGRETRKLARKEKRGLKRQRAREQRQTAAQAGDGDVQVTTTTSAKAPLAKGKKERLKLSAKPLPLAFALDCGFDELMTDKEIISLASQITRCYSEISTAGNRTAKMVIAGFDRRLKQRFDTVLQAHHHNWKGVEIYEQPLVDALKEVRFSQSSVEIGKAQGIWSDADLEASEAPIDGHLPVKDAVYLTADSPHTLDKLQPYTTYIVGALVDRNRHKNICLERAEELGIRTAKLPIGEYLEMRARKVLATNHVIEIMLGWLQDQDWTTALQRGVPARTGAVARTGGDEQHDTMESNVVDEQQGDNEGVDMELSQGDLARTAEISNGPE